MLDQTKTVPVQKFDGTSDYHLDDAVLVEEPLEVLIEAGKQPAISVVTMRTPNDDKALAVGFLYTEGLLASQNDIESTEQLDDNRIKIKLLSEQGMQNRNYRREFIRTSSCGLCGDQSLKTLKLMGAVQQTAVEIDKAIIDRCVQKLKPSQLIFKQTGGSHGVAGFNLDADHLATFEDVGRHNALDKLIGHAVLKQLDIPIIVTSSRGGYEMVQKAIMAKAKILVCIGAPTSLAIETARHYGLRLIGFVKGDVYNLYC